MRIVISRRTLIIFVFVVALVGVVGYRLTADEQVSKAQEPRPTVYVASGQTYEHNGITITLPATWSGSMMSSAIKNSTDSADILFLDTDTPQSSLAFFYDQNKMIEFIESLNASPESSPTHYGRSIAGLIFALEDQLQAARKQETEAGAEKPYDLYELMKDRTQPLMVGGKEGYLALSDTSEDTPPEAKLTKMSR